MDALTQTWVHDPSHYPEPLTPLSADVWLRAMGEGIQAAARELRAPFGGFETTIHAGGWAYEHELEPTWEPDAARFERCALEIGERWEREYRPRVEELTAEIERLEPEEGAPALDRLLELVHEQWRIHFLTVIPVHAARELLHDAYVERFGKRDELEPYRLLEGLPNETLAADELLWRAAERARSLAVEPRSLTDLEETAEGREVLAVLAHYLERYGGRSRLHELSEPRIAERPELVLETVRLLLARPRDLPAERHARAAERDRLEHEVLARVQDPADRRAFADLLARVKAAVPLEESHAYYIDYPGLYATRRALLGFGSRLVEAGSLAAADDVFFLRLGELRETLVAPRDLRDLVAARRTERNRARGERPEPYLGPAPPPGEASPMMAKFYGVPGTARRVGEVLHGTPASAGRAAGPARVVRGPEDFERVRAGDILVCATTTPAWTPLFGSLAGLVTDTGGILSHAAVVAREYGLPAVVGAEVATTVIPDGAEVKVDGEAGEVRFRPLGA